MEYQNGAYSYVSSDIGGVSEIHVRYGVFLQVCSMFFGRFSYFFQKVNFLK